MTPSAIAETNLPNLLHRGKVRDTYDLGDGLLLMVATDRISAFDVVLPTPVPEKGVVLAGLSAFWFRQTRHLVPNHLVAMADDREALGGRSLPAMSRDVARRAMVVHRAERVDVECVARGYITGSAWSEYRRSGTVNGEPMPAGLQEGDRFPEPLFTPTTKAETGHDEPISRHDLPGVVGAELAGELERLTVAVYQWAHDYALSRGIILADTKVEFGTLDGQLILIDELLTPDSSRFWDGASYKPGQSQPNFDKQYVRDWLTAAGWDREPPAPELPADVVERSRERYFEAYRLLTGASVPQ